MIRLVRRLTGSTLLGCVGRPAAERRRAALRAVAARRCSTSSWRSSCSARSPASSPTVTGTARMARLVPSGRRTTAEDWGPVRALLWRPWRLAAGVMFGLAVARSGTRSTRWPPSGCWCGCGTPAPGAPSACARPAARAGRRRPPGVRLPRGRRLRGLPAHVDRLAAARREYEEALSNTQYGAYWGSTSRPSRREGPGEIVQSLRSLWYYHQDVYTFHTHFLDDADTPTSPSRRAGCCSTGRWAMQADLDIEPGEQGCDAPEGSTCLRQVLLLGTPALWWGGRLALLYSSTPGWRAGTGASASRWSASRRRGCRGSGTTTGRSSPSTRSRSCRSR